jgi:type II secretory pathway pseudopilin PulG
MRRNESGFTLVEVTVILMVLVILSAILLVQIGGFNRMARFAKVKEDVGAICTAIAAYITDTGENNFWNHGWRDPDSPDRSWPVGLLVGDGDIPDGNATTGDSGDRWRATVGSYITVESDFRFESLRFTVDTLANHLIHNTPQDEPNQGYRTPANMIDGDNSSRIPGGLRFDPPSGQGFNSMFAWRGPYISDRVDPDPWGNRYMANVFGLYHPQGDASDGFATAVVCYSAGPDEEIDTAFNQPGGWQTGDDDYAAIVTAGAS